MKTAFVVFVILSISAAVPIDGDAQAKILNYENESDGQGNYEFSFQTSNGIERKETGKVVNIGQPNEHTEVQGFYSFLNPEGKLFKVHYTADENGYHVDDSQPVTETPSLPDLTPPFQMVAFGLPSAAVATLLG